VTFAFSSMDETEERLHDGILREYWTDSQLAAARRYIRRLTPAMRNFRDYLNTESLGTLARNLSDDA